MEAHYFYWYEGQEYKYCDPKFDENPCIYLLMSKRREAIVIWPYVVISKDEN